MRVAFLTNIVSPYRAPVLRELAATPGWQLRVFVNADTEFDRRWQGCGADLDVRQSPTWTLRRRVVSHRPVRSVQRVALHLPYGSWTDLRRFRPDVVIAHELGPRTWIAAAYCRLHRVPLVVWSYQSRAGASAFSPWRRRLQRWLLGQADAVVGMGSQAREVLERQRPGLGPTVIDAPNAPDLPTCERRLRSAAGRAGAQAFHDRHGRGRRLAVVVGRLIPVKAIDAVLDAWQGLPPELARRWRLVFVGEGPLEPYVRERAVPGVEIAGYVEPGQVADVFAAADLHLFASLADTWGLVANEAMLAATPTLCSVHAGCADDLIEHGRDGWLFDPTDRQEFGRQLRAVLARPDLDAIGERARARARSFTIAGMAHSFRTAVARARGARASQPAAAALR